MKRASILLVIAGALALASCSGDSPSPPAMPTPTADSWAITSLTVSDPSPYAGQTVVVTATVTKNGQAAPDGTSVTITVTSPGVLFSCATGSVASGTTEAKVNTSGGQAEICLFAAQGGTYSVVAQVASATRSLNVTFSDACLDEPLQVHSIVPDADSQEGGATVTLYGTGLCPSEVRFEVAGNVYQAQIVSTAADWSSVQVVTPKPGGLDPAQEYLATITVSRVGAGGTAESVSLADVFRYLPTTGDPEIYSVFPAQGSSRGGDQVTVYGRNFAAPVRVTFETDLGTVEADELAVSADGSQITLTTPPLSATPVEGDHVANVTVYNEAGTPREKAVNKANAFVFLADHPTPVINAIDPLSGPMEGGTRVTIFGSGFEFPVQVTFGTREANVISVAYDQIVVVSPDYTPTGETPPVTVDVTVRNVASGLTATSPVGFTYGEAMFITSNSPSEGDATGGDLVTIFGSGFRAPLTVTWAGGGGAGVAQSVVSVSGNQVVIRTAALDPLPCDDQEGPFTITQVDSGATATGGSWTYRGESPRIASVNPPSGSYPMSVTINGDRFRDPVRVTFGDSPAQLLSPVDENTISTTIPDPVSFGLTFESVACTGTLGPGCREVSTAVDVTVVNVNSGCQDTLENGFTYDPPSSACQQLVPAASPALIDFGTVAVGSSANATITLSNNGAAGDLTFDWTGSTADPFTITPASGTLAPGDSVTVTVTFTPSVPGPAGGAVTFQVVGGGCAAQTSVSVQLSGDGV